MTISRRQLLWTGAAATLATMLPWSRRTGRADTAGSSKNLIVLLALGGWDTSYSIDPKPVGGGVDAPPGTITTHGGIDVLEDASRPAIGAFFARYAAITAVVRGIHMPSVAHAACVQSILTGARNETSADLAAIVAHEHGNDLPIPYLVLGNNAFAGPYAASMGRVGPTNQLVGLLDPASSYPVIGQTRENTFVPTASDESYVRAYTLSRAQREKATRGATGYNRRRVDDFVNSLTRGDRLRELRDGLGSSGTLLGLAQQRQLALDAIETGISRTVMLSVGQSFDTHETNTTQGPAQQFLFDNLTQLVGALEARPGQQSGTTMLDDTIVLVLSEMGRTPRLNSAMPVPGKDHWPVTSAMVIGTDIRGGMAYGGTTATGEGELVDLETGAIGTGATHRSLEPRHLAAGVLAACGVDPQSHLPEAEVFRAFLA
ncbi:MAG: DUF1501 domain-containing protein [Kofleriaceae bacterium]